MVLTCIHGAIYNSSLYILLGQVENLTGTSQILSNLFRSSQVMILQYREYYLLVSLIFIILAVQSRRVFRSTDSLKLLRVSRR